MIRSRQELTSQQDELSTLPWFRSEVTSKTTQLEWLKKELKTYKDQAEQSRETYSRVTVPAEVQKMNRNLHIEIRDLENWLQEQDEFNREMVTENSTLSHENMVLQQESMHINMHLITESNSYKQLYNVAEEWQQEALKSKLLLAPPAKPPPPIQTKWVPTLHTDNTAVAVKTEEPASSSSSTNVPPPRSDQNLEGSPPQED